jgi:hypothetical protein
MTIDKILHFLERNGYRQAMVDGHPAWPWQLDDLERSQ